MLTDQPHVLELVALMRAHGVRRVVLCPGSRDVPLVVTLAALPDFLCTGVTDERSAGFVALGIINATGEPCAVVVTSGSALLNLHPAVAEAAYQRRPLLILSADRPAAWIHQMDGQTLVQTGVFGGLTAFDGNLPEIQDDTSRWHCNRMVNEALLALRHHQRPVHLNIPISEPFFSAATPVLPRVRVIEKLSPTALAAKLTDAKRPWLILGQSPCGKRIPTEKLEALAKRFGVVAEHLSNAGAPGVATRMDLMLANATEAQKNALAPDAVVYLGGHIVSKHLKRFLRRLACPQFLAADEEPIADLFQNLTGVAFTSFDEAVDALLTTPERPQVFEGFYRAEAFADEIVKALLLHGTGQAALTGRILEALPERTVLHLANSSTVRYAQFFGLPSRGIRTEVNRGVNGIEGSLSEAVGGALADPDHLHVLLIGDLAFFYDMNALALAPQNLRVALFHNGGGEIFGALPGLTLAGRAKAFVCATHETKAGGWARDCGAVFEVVEDAQGFERALPEFLKTDGGLRLLEIRTSEAKDLEALAAFGKGFRAAFQSVDFVL